MNTKVLIPQENNHSLDALFNPGDFVGRHIGPSPDDQASMLQELGYGTMDEFIDAVVPANIRLQKTLDLGASMTEQQALAELRTLADKNRVFKSFIGQGYYNTYTPHVIARNVLENPAWYTAYTPYQPEISQGRLEALLNYQTMVADLTGMDLASASLLDEGTAAAEAMTLCRRMSKAKGNVFFVDRNCLAQTIDIIRTRAEPLGIEMVVGDPADVAAHGCFGILLQYPGADGEIVDFRDVIQQAHEQGSLVVMATDILSLLLLASPGELGADVAIGNSQRFGVPMGFGGPHAAYMATRESFKRSLPGRLVGVSIDSNGNAAYRLALQTREQHIRREKATSNICTAQALLAIMASMYAVYHGPVGLTRIAQRVHLLTAILAKGLRQLGQQIVNQGFFDTLTIACGENTARIHARAVASGVNLRRIDENRLGISLDETATEKDVEMLWRLFAPDTDLLVCDLADCAGTIPPSLKRSGEVLSYPVFNSYHSETEMLRYLRKLSDRDIALDRAMIPLGSCTMKLNATAEMLPVSWPEFSQLHPFAPLDQAQGYLEMIGQLERMLCEITGYHTVSLQPNAGSQGEYAGLLAIRAYHASRGEHQRDVCLIPGSAHGTNPASAQMCGMRVVVVRCDEYGNVDLDDLRVKVAEFSDRLAAIMITYPSTHGVFEEGVLEVCAIIHSHGGQVYIDGANLNAMVGLCKPGFFGGDVSHLNLHKTFCIPHGGGGPGVGPVAVAEHLAPFLPGHRYMPAGTGLGPVSAAPWGSAGILPISWMYIRMMGAEGLKQATEAAILNANYLCAKLAESYPILYTGSTGHVAHECILDLRPLKEATGVTVDDLAKRLIDFGFHAPTMSFPVAETLMIEPTESESKAELDRFVEAMKTIRVEIAAVARGDHLMNQSPLHFAPHTAASLMTETWDRGYSREQGAYPVDQVRQAKYWPPVGRIDNVYGDKNLYCSCPSVDSYV